MRTPFMEEGMPAKILKKSRHAATAWLEFI
jgi:hypothetical protein